MNIRFAEHVYIVTLEGLTGTFTQKIVARCADGARQKAERLFRYAPVQRVDYGWPYFR